MTENQSPPCPICGGEMVFFYGCQWDYDRWICLTKTGRFSSCEGEIELDTTTTPEELDSGP